MYSGVITALVTPFKDNEIDFASFERLIGHQISGGVKSIVVAGSTGEATSLSDYEYKVLMSVAVKYQHQLNIIACCSHSSTQKVVEMALLAQEAGVSGLMVTIPYYIKPSQEGLYRHFKAVHDATHLPLMIYSVPGRTGVDFADETIVRLCELERVVGFKDAGGDLERPLRLTNKLGDRLNLLSGDDSLALAFNAQGANGVVSVASNVIPHQMVEVQELWVGGKFNEALRAHAELVPLYKAMFVESNPVPVKYALSLMGLCSSEVRPALCELEDSNKILLQGVLKNYC